MQGGKAAAESAINMQATGDYSAASTRQYERRWNFLYGYDFGKVCVTLLLGRSIIGIMRVLTRVASDAVIHMCTLTIEQWSV